MSARISEKIEKSDILWVLAHRYGQIEIEKLVIMTGVIELTKQAPVLDRQTVGKSYLQRPALGYGRLFAA